MVEEVLTEEEKGEIEADEIRRATAFLSVEAIVMFPIAIVLDLAGLLLAIFGVSEIFSFIPDVIGLLTIGIWTYFHSQTVKVTHGAAARLTKVVKWARWLRWLRPLLIIFEFIPFVGAAPCWIILVWLELKYS